MGELTLLRSAVPFQSTWCYHLIPMFDYSWLPQKDPLGYCFLRPLAFLTALIRKVFVIAGKSFLYVQRAPCIIWLKPEHSVSTLKTRILWLNVHGWLKPAWGKLSLFKDMHCV